MRFVLPRPLATVPKAVYAEKMAATVCSWQTVLKWSNAMAAQPEKRKAAAAVEQVLRCVDRRQIRNWRVAADVYQTVKAVDNHRFEHFTPGHALEVARLAEPSFRPSRATTSEPQRELDPWWIATVATRLFPCCD